MKRTRETILKLYHTLGASPGYDIWPLSSSIYMFGVSVTLLV